MEQSTEGSASDYSVYRGVALVRLGNTVGSIMSQSRSVLTESKKIPGGPLPEATQKLLEELERAANAACMALLSDPEARY